VKRTKKELWALEGPQNAVAGSMPKDWEYHVHQHATETAQLLAQAAREIKADSDRKFMVMYADHALASVFSWAQLGNKTQTAVGMKMYDAALVEAFR